MYQRILLREKILILKKARIGKKIRHRKIKHVSLNTLSADIIVEIYSWLNYSGQQALALTSWWYHEIYRDMPAQYRVSKLCAGSMDMMCRLLCMGYMASPNLDYCQFGNTCSITINPYVYAHNFYGDMISTRAGNVVTFGMEDSLCRPMGCGVEALEYLYLNITNARSGNQFIDETFSGNIRIITGNNINVNKTIIKSEPKKKQQNIIARKKHERHAAKNVIKQYPVQSCMKYRKSFR